ncbi:MAG: hypothetical protein IPO03_03005 [Bacteroidetes bacterium]|jgi:hypothetical protein|nr:hypothetical protein [Bacteroidota bacterium]MBL0280992.1 hypothetical protein [Bacteroidota bacterium]
MIKNKTDKGLQKNERQSNKLDLGKQKPGAEVLKRPDESKHPVKEEEESYESNINPANNLTDPQRKNAKTVDDEALEQLDENERMNKRIDTDTHEAEFVDDEDIDEDNEDDIDENKDIDDDNEDDIDENKDIDDDNEDDIDENKDEFDENGTLI